MPLTPPSGFVLRSTLFLTAVGTLLLEILLTRVLSVVMWYHFTFAVISMALLGIAAGLVLAFILSYVINVSFFGWTISWATPWGFLLGLPIAVIVAALAAGYWPARQAAHLDIADGVKME